MKTSSRLSSITLILLLVILSHSTTSGYQFETLSTGEHLIHSELFGNVRSSIECGTWCARRRLDNGVDRMCEAYSYNPSRRRCQLYVAQIGGKDAYGDTVYKYRSIDEDPEDGFDFVTNGGQTYIFYISTNPMTFLDARAHCQGLGGYIVNFDSSDEFDALVTYAESKGIATGQLWVGAQDIDSEGQWVTDRHHLPLDYGTWRFGPGEPSDSGTGEDCGTYYARGPHINDAPCDHTHPAVCERTP